MQPLSLPIRGHIERVAALGERLFIQTRHPEGVALGVYRVELGQLIRGSLRGEEALSLLSAERGAPITWIEAAEGALWAIDSEGGLWRAEGGASALERVAALGAPVTHAARCAEGLAWADSSGGVHLWRAEGEGWRWSSASEGAEGEEAADELPTVSALYSGHGALIAGLSDGSMRLWGGGEAGELSPEPITIKAHSAPLSALLTLEAEGKPYLLSYCEGLQLMQTRLDDLSPMSRAAKGKGLHTLPVSGLTAGPLGRFYSYGRDGSVKAWQEAYSNLRPASHDELGELVAGALFECPLKDLDGQWPLKPTLALATSKTLTLYDLISEAKEGEEAQLGRLGSARYAITQAEAWLEAQLKSPEQALRAALLSRVEGWGDAQALEALSRLAAHDDDPKLRLKAVKALLKSAHPRIIHTLEGLLSSADDKVSCEAFKGLRKAHGAESLYPMKRALERGGEAVSVEACAAYAERAALRDEAALVALKALLKNGRVAVAQAARQELERAIPALDATLIALNSSSHNEVKVAAVQRMYRLGLTSQPRVQSRLQALREDEELSLREAALSATLLSRHLLSQLLRSADELLHEQLRKFEALDLTGDERSGALSQARPARPALSDLSQDDRQALFELSACACPDIAIYGPVALAELGDLRALPILLALSRADDKQVRLRATRGLSALAASGERRALSPLKSLCSDDASPVRLAAYEGLSALLAQEVIHYVEVGLSSGHHDVRLAFISAAQRLGLPSGEGDAWRVLRLALVHQGDLELAREARKVYLRDEVGGDALGTQLALLESAHEEIRHATLHDMVAALKAGRGLSGAPAPGEGSGLGEVKGKSFLFTGTLSRLKRSEAQKKVISLGGVKAGSVSGSLDYLVLGDEGKAGSKLDKARKLGVRVLSETEFMDMVGEGVGETAVGAEEPQAPPTEEGVTSEQDPYEWIRRLSEALLDDPSEALRAEVRRSLIGESEGKGALVSSLRLEVIGYAMRSRHVDNRLNAISALSGVEDVERAVELLSERLSDPSSEVSTSALKAALKLSDEAAERLLSSGMSHESEGVRGAALAAAISAPKRSPWREGLLWGALEDASASLRAEAMEALDGDEALEVAERLLEASYDDIRGRAALTLARRGDQRAVPFALEALSAPRPTAEEVQAAQEALDGGLGLLDERRWRREVTVALFAHQEAIAQASASASASGEQAYAMSDASTSSSTRQSVEMLVYVQDQIEGAHSRAVGRWREAIQRALEVAIEGEFTEVWEAVWALRDHDDLGARRASWAAWPAVAPREAVAALSEQLRDEERGPHAAEALARLGALDGLLSLRGRGASIMAQLSACHLIDDLEWRERVGAEAVTSGGEAGTHAVLLELARLLSQGGGSSLLTAALSSDDAELRRFTAGLIERAHSAEELLSHWVAQMEERRPQAERQFDQQLAAFKAGERAEKPKGRAPKWPSEGDWASLFSLVLHPNAAARARGERLLKALPSDSAEAERLLSDLKRYVTRYGAGGAEGRAPMDLSREEGRALAFGAYTGLLTLTRDAQALRELTRLIDVDPAGSLALLTVALRGEPALRSAAREALHQHREALQLSELDLAERLLSTGASACVSEGAAMIARLSEARSLELIRGDDREAAETALEVSLKLRPTSALTLMSAALNSASPSLRSGAVSRALRLLKAAEQLGWRAETEAPAGAQEATSPAGLSEEVGRRYGLGSLDVTMIQGLSELSEAPLGDLVYEQLLGVLSPEEGGKPAFADVQLLIAEGLAARQDERAFEPLARALQSDEPSLSERGLKGLTLLKSSRSAPTIMSRLLNDSAGSLDQDAALFALAKLRDSVVAPELLALFGDERFDDDDLSRTVLKISGFDVPIGEDEVWEEMSKEAREAEERRAYQSATLAQHITASVRAGRFSDVLYYENLIDAAQTARSPAPELDQALVALFSLPRGGSELDELRRGAVKAYGWRAQRRESDPAPLLTLLEHRDDETRWEAALGLAHAQRSEGLDLLLQLLKDKVHGYSWRSRAAKALGACADLRAVRALLRVYDDPEDGLTEEALEALGHMGRSEVAEEIRARLIAGLYQRDLASLAIQGMRFMDHPETWGTLRGAVRHARVSQGLQLEALRALSHDRSEESLELFKWLLTNASGATRERGSSVHLEAYRGWRGRLEPLPELEGLDEGAELSSPESLAPEEALFRIDSTNGPEWARAVSALERFGGPAMWLSLCFEASELSKAHQDASARFEAQLRQLDPAPLELLFEALPRAAESAPRIADMTLSLIGARAEELGAQEREKLLEVTAELRGSWRASLAEGLGAPIRSGSELEKRLRSQGQTWERLLWLWGRVSGGEEELWSALETEGLSPSLAREALLSLSALSSQGALSLDERLLSCPAVAHPALTSLVTSLIGRSASLAQRALVSLPEEGALALDTPASRASLWGALSRAGEGGEPLAEALTRSTLAGDPLALDALVRGQHTSVALSLVESLGDDAYGEALTCSILSGVAELGDEGVEEALVTLAGRSKREQVVKSAWRARRRSSRARARREA